MFEFQVPLKNENASSRFGRAMARIVQPGDTLLLQGQIGAGKTHFSRALIQEKFRLDGRTPPDVPSPTFTLVQTYELAKCEIWHVDLYRLSDNSEIPELGLDLALEDQICLVEWPERLEDAPPASLTIQFMPNGAGRIAMCRGSATRWNVLPAVLGSLDA